MATVVDDRVLRPTAPRSAVVEPLDEPKASKSIAPLIALGVLGYAVFSALEPVARPSRARAAGDNIAEGLNDWLFWRT